jgi:mutator protein MutT
MSLKRRYPSQPIVGIGALIVCNGKILLEKRKNDPGKGKWSIPGGLVELGEGVEKTVVREVAEETCLTVDSPELVDVVDNITFDRKGQTRYHFVILDYWVKLKGGTVKAASDADELRWVEIDDVLAYDLTKTFRQFIERNKHRLRRFDSCR